jgi:hypothetical protein
VPRRPRTGPPQQWARPVHKLRSPVVLPSRPPALSACLHTSRRRTHPPRRSFVRGQVVPHRLVQHRPLRPPPPVRPLVLPHLSLPSHTSPGHTLPLGSHEPPWSTVRLWLCLQNVSKSSQRGVHLGGVEEGETALHGRADEGEIALRVRPRAVEARSLLAPEPQGRHLQGAQPPAGQARRRGGAARVRGGTAGPRRLLRASPSWQQ